MSSVFHIREHIIPGSHIREYARATSVSQEEELMLHIKQYSPKDNDHPQKGDVTIIGAHANGFPKELYEPLWEDLYHSLKAIGVRIRSVWIADAAWQGRSGILNRGKLGNEPGWYDYARDITHMINTFRMPRPITAVGHSFGANALTNVALSNPRLFTCVSLQDPVIDRQVVTGSYFLTNLMNPVLLSAFRRDVWPSREAAANALKKSKFYQAWDSRVFERWIEFGLTALSSSTSDEVTLTTTVAQEVSTFVRSSIPAFDAEGLKVVHPEAIPDIDYKDETIRFAYPAYRHEMIATYDRLPNLRPATLFVFGGQSYMSQLKERQLKLNTTGTGTGGSGGLELGMVKGVVNDHCGHLIPLEAPAFCADEIAIWIKQHLQKWKEDEAKYEAWTKQSETVKSSMDPALMTIIKKTRESKM